MLIGVAGYARSGKDEIGKCLARRGFAVTRFSQVLKDEILARMPRTLDAIATLTTWTDGDTASWQTFRATTREVLEADAFRRWLVEVAKPLGVRELLQEYGTEVRRGDDPNYWVNAWARGAHGENEVVVDVRFPNEAKTIRQQGGVLWRVSRPGVGPLHDHASEHQAFEVDRTIQNDGTLEDLDVRVGHAIEDRCIHDVPMFRSCPDCSPNLRPGWPKVYDPEVSFVTDEMRERA